jgi:hypothetical protein
MTKDLKKLGTDAMVRVREKRYESAIFQVSFSEGIFLEKPVSILFSYFLL